MRYFQIKVFSAKKIEIIEQVYSILGGHPEFDKVPGVEASTGALGHGSPIGLGIALGAKIEKRIFILMLL